MMRFPKRNDLFGLMAQTKDNEMNLIAFCLFQYFYYIT